MEVADRVVVMNQGRIEQVGPPDEVYDHPATPFVLQFLGDVNLFHGRSEVSYVRPHELEVLGAPAPDAWPATLSQTLTVGAQTRLEFEREGDDGPLDVQLPREAYRLLRESLNLERGSRVWLRPRKVRRFAVDADSLDPAAAI
jgi:sulfate transport system ATP-binding protein